MKKGTTKEDTNLTKDVGIALGTEKQPKGTTFRINRFITHNRAHGGGDYSKEGFVWHAVCEFLTRWERMQGYDLIDKKNAANQ